MDFITAALMIGGGIIKAQSEVDKGIAADRQAQLDALNIETDDTLNQAQAIQMANARQEEYASATFSNEAAFAAMGRDIGSDTSYRAFLAKQKSTVGSDLRNVQNQSKIQSIKASAEAGAVRTAGRDARRAGKVSAVTTLLSTAYKYQQAK